jgi:hypothetical protein
MTDLVVMRRIKAGRIRSLVLFSPNRALTCRPPGRRRVTSGTRVCGAALEIATQYETAVAKFMKANNTDHGRAPKSRGLAK